MLNIVTQLRHTLPLAAQHKRLILFPFIWKYFSYKSQFKARSGYLYVQISPSQVFHFFCYVSSQEESSPLKAKYVSEVKNMHMQKLQVSTPGSQICQTCTSTLFRPMVNKLRICSPSFPKARSPRSKCLPPSSAGKPYTC